MASTIAGLLRTGFSAATILKRLLRNNPAMTSRINRALDYGYPAETILRYLAKSEKGSQEEAFKTEHEKTSERDRAAKRKGAIGLGLGAAALASVPFGLRAAASLGRGIMPNQILPAQNALPAPAAQRLLPQLLQSPANKAQTPPPTSPPIQPPQTPHPPPVTPPQMPTNPSIAPEQPPLAPNQPIKPEEILPEVKKLQENEENFKNNWNEIHGRKVPSTELLKYAKKLVKSGDIKNFDQFKEFSKWWDSAPKEKRASPTAEFELFRKQTKGFSPAFGDQNKLPEESSGTVQGNQKKLVITSKGDLGTVQEEKGKISKVEINGKIHNKISDDLIESPLPEKDLADLYDDLIQGIQKETGQEISRMADFVGYDPNINELVFKPYDGAVYRYTDISSEDVDELKDILAQRKTTGENFIGAWKQGTKSPIGNRMTALIQRLQQKAGGKGKEYKGKYEVVYSAHEPAIKAKKEKFRNEKARKKPKK